MGRFGLCASRPFGLAAPIRDHAGAVVAALSISMPAYRFEDRRRMVEPLKAAASTISRRLAAGSGDGVPAEMTHPALPAAV